jgi:hypothetical protein
MKIDIVSFGDKPSRVTSLAFCLQPVEFHIFGAGFLRTLLSTTHVSASCPLEQRFPGKMKEGGHEGRQHMCDEFGFCFSRELSRRIPCTDQQSAMEPCSPRLLIMPTIPTAMQGTHPRIPLMETMPQPMRLSPKRWLRIRSLQKASKAPISNLP